MSGGPSARPMGAKPITTTDCGMAARTTHPSGGHALPGRFLLDALLVLLALAGAGCSAGTGTVSGTVRCKGEPLPFGRISFHCQTGDKRVLAGTIRDGVYTVYDIPVGP